MSKIFIRILGGGLGVLLVGLGVTTLLRRFGGDSESSWLLALIQLGVGALFVSYSLRKQDQDVDGDSPVTENVNPAARPPGCFSAFTADYLQETVGEAILDEQCFVAFTLTCKCGNRSLIPAATPVDSNHEKVTFESAAMLLAPVVVSCPECGNSSTVFDPRVHGWDGQIGESASAFGDDDPSPCSPTGGLIRVDVSYQGEESYSNLAADGVQNLEDYFDTISISIRPDGSDEWQEVVSYECA